MCKYIIHLFLFMIFTFQISMFLLWIIFITYILPIISLFLYYIGYTNNAWDMNSKMINYLTKTKIINVNKMMQPFITNGVIITNHRCFSDFYLDPYLFSCPGIARQMAMLVCGFIGIISLSFNRGIIIDRRQDRNTIFSYILSLGHKLIMFYPEGTRCSHLTLPENYKEIILKYGLLKSIWENKENTRIQIIISKNKEKVLNEKTFEIGYGVNVYYITGKPIYTRDYSTFDEFMDKIKLDWHTLWNEIFSLPENKITFENSDDENSEESDKNVDENSENDDNGENKKNDDENDKNENSENDDNGENKKNDDENDKNENSENDNNGENEKNENDDNENEKNDNENEKYDGIDGIICSLQ